MITEIEDYFTKGCGRCPRFGTYTCSAYLWNEGVVSLRDICLTLGMSEHVKWGHPCYMHAGRNICIIGAFRDNFRLTFMKASLLSDPNQILQNQGPNAQHPDMIRFESASEVQALQDIIRAYLQEAMVFAEKGIVPEKSTREFEWPEELIDALDSDPEFAESFHALTLGRRNSYLFHFNNTAKSETRIARIEKSRTKIFAGLGQNEYQK